MISAESHELLTQYVTNAPESFFSFPAEFDVVDKLSCSARDLDVDLSPHASKRVSFVLSEREARRVLSGIVVQSIENDRSTMQFCSYLTTIGVET